MVMNAIKANRNMLFGFYVVILCLPCKSPPSWVCLSQLGYAWCTI